MPEPGSGIRLKEGLVVPAVAVLLERHRPYRRYHLSLRLAIAAADLHLGLEVVHEHPVGLVFVGDGVAEEYALSRHGEWIGPG